MSAPKRVQRRRVKGEPGMPAGARYVGRPSKWGNPYGVSGETDAAAAVALFRDMLNRAPKALNGSTVFDDIRKDLRGRDLACWCPLDQPCHADVLLEVANS